MSVIYCPECGNQVSEYATACPNCGYNVKEYFDKEKRQQEYMQLLSTIPLPKYPKREWILIVLAGCLLIFTLISLYFETFFMAFLTFIMVILVIYLEEKDFRRRADTYVFSVQDPDGYRKKVLELRHQQATTNNKTGITFWGLVGAIVVAVLLLSLVGGFLFGLAVID